MQNFLSVIIPTIQKRVDILSSLVECIEKDACVDEILVINNKPESPLIFNNSKIRVITPSENLYVNPSWNLGIKEIRNENFLLLNDDLMVGENFCGRIINSTIFNSPNTGLIGMKNSNLIHFDIDCVFSDAEPEFDVLENHLGTGDWGVSIFGRKENYYEIPNDIRIIYGDNYLLYRNKLNNKINYAISNLQCHHIHSLSCSSSEFVKVVSADIKNSNKYFRDDNNYQNQTVNNVQIGNIVENYTEIFKDITINDINIQIVNEICKINISEYKFFTCMKVTQNNKLLAKDDLEQKLDEILHLNNKNLINKIAEKIYTIYQSL